jgi:phosphinothricin acetyltransferase
MLIRPAAPEDLPAVTDIYNHYVLHSTAVFAERPLSVTQRRGWFEQFALRGPHRLFVAEEAGRLLGYACSVPFLPAPAYRETVETTIFLTPGHTRRGLGTRLYGALFEALAGERLHRAYAGVVPPNRASLTLHKRFGFRTVGLYREYALKWGRYHSSWVLEKRLGPGHPLLPRPRGLRGAVTSTPRCGTMHAGLFPAVPWPEPDR